MDGWLNSNIPEIYNGSKVTEIFWFINVIGACISTLLCIILIFHLIRLRYLICPSFDLLSYYIMMTIYISFCICSVFAALFRSNIIISINSFPICTHIMLAVYHILWCVGKIFCTLYYIYRIHIIFQHSTYNIKKTTLIAFAVLIVFSGCIGIVMVPILSYDNIELAISRHGYKHCQIGPYINVGFTTLLIIEGALHGIVNIILIYLFISRLLALVHGMIPNSSARSSHNHNIFSNMSYNTFDTDFDDSKFEKSYPIMEVSKNISKEVSKEKYYSEFSDANTTDKKTNISDDYSERRVETMTQLMSKQTILVILYITSTSIIFFGQIIYDSIAYLVPLDIIINVLCIWFSLKYGNSIWNILIKCCSNICCCCCCFCKCHTRNKQMIIQPRKHTIATTYTK